MTDLAVLDDFEPSLSIFVSYPLHHKAVDLGNKIKPQAVAVVPNFEIVTSSIASTKTLNPSASFTLVLTDPDATSRAEPVKA